MRFSAHGAVRWGARGISLQNDGPWRHDRWTCDGRLVGTYYHASSLEIVHLWDGDIWIDMPTAPPLEAPA